MSEVWVQCGFAGAVLAAAALGARHGLVGVAALVSIVIGLMGAAQAGMALRFTGARWRSFLWALAPGGLIGLLSAGVTATLRLALERLEWSHLAILAALVLGGALSVPLGVYLLPARVRPTELFSRLAESLRGLPGSFRMGALFVLRTGL